MQIVLYYLISFEFSAFGEMCFRELELVYSSFYRDIATF